MKICWDMLESVRLTINGFFRKGGITYIYKECCETCGESYLTIKSNQSAFCGHSCAISGKNHPMYGKHLPVKIRKKISVAHTGKTASIETRKKMSLSSTGMTHSIKTREKMSKNSPRRSGVLISNWRGGVKALGLTTYETHKNTLGPYETIRKQIGTEILEVKCAYCGRWFSPTYTSVHNRLVAINNLNKGEHRFYCSENCKQACPTYNRRKYPKGFKHTTSREVSPYLRKMVLERDSWTCQICGKTGAECQLHCHHMDPVAQNPIFQNDMDSCITLCKGCHKMVHSRKGCRYVDLQCKRSY